MTDCSEAFSWAFFVCGIVGLSRNIPCCNMLCVCVSTQSVYALGYVVVNAKTVITAQERSCIYCGYFSENTG